MTNYKYLTIKNPSGRGRSFTYAVFDDCAERVDVWAHEFTEGSINELLFNDGFRNTWISINNTVFGEIEMNIPHILTSFHCISGTHEGKLINPDEFIKIILGAKND